MDEDEKKQFREMVSKYKEESQMKVKKYTFDEEDLSKVIDYESLINKKIKNNS